MKPIRFFSFQLITLMVLCMPAFADDPPLSPEVLRALMQAKTVYIVSGHVRYFKTKALVKSQLVDETPFAEPTQKELEKWGRFKVVSTMHDADLVIRVYLKGHTESVPVISPGVTGSVNAGQTFTVLDVVQPSSGKLLWSVSKNDAWSWSNKTALAGLVKKFREFLEQQEKSPQAVSDAALPPAANSSTASNGFVAPASPTASPAPNTAPTNPTPVSEAGSAAPLVDESLEDTQYTNWTGRFSLTLPHGWMMNNEVHRRPITQLSSRDHRNFLIVSTVSDGRPLETYKEGKLLELQKTVPDFDLVSESSTVIGGKRAALLTYRSKTQLSSTHFLHFEAIVPSEGGYVSMLAFCKEADFPKMRPVFEQIFNSFHSIAAAKE